jgi:hypothetical protein
MGPAGIFVWRVRLCLLATAMGLVAVNTDNNRTPTPESIQVPVAHRSSEELLTVGARLQARDNGDAVILRAANKKQTFSRVATRPANRLWCSGRPASQSRASMHSSMKAKPCKPSNKIAHSGYKHKAGSAINMKRHASLAPSRKPRSSGPALKLARKSDVKATTAAVKPRNLARTG